MNGNSQIPHSHRRRPPWPPPPDPSVWGSDVQWLLQYDNIIRHPGGKIKGCHCDIHFYDDVKPTTNSRDNVDAATLGSSSSKGFRSAGVSLEDLSKKVSSLDIKKSYGTLGRRPNTARPSTPMAQAQAGAVDEATFRAAFLNVPIIQLYAPSDLRDAFKTIFAALANSEEDWEKRVEAYRKIRSLLTTTGESQEFLDQLKKLEIPIVDSFKDLRSQVVREACITIAFLAEKLKLKITILVEFAFPNIIALIQNSAKIMSSSALVAMRFIMENVQSHRLLNLTIGAITSKSKDIRRAICEMLCIIFSAWPVTILDKKHVDLKSALQKGIGDADPEARQFARKAFCSYKSKFPDRADELLRSLDASYRRALDTGSGSVENVSERAKPTPASARAVRKSPTPERGPAFKRSNTAMDPHAAQRANARAQYAAMYRFRGPGGSGRPSATPSMANSQIELMDDSETPTNRSRARAPRYSRSQPTSRSASPCGIAMALRPPPRVLSRSSIPSPIDTPRDISRRPSGSQIRNSSRLPDYGFSLALMRNETDGMRSMSGERSSDESETSSLGDRSYSGAPTSPGMPISEILNLLTKPEWIDRRDGLHHLRDHLRNSALTQKELKRAVESLNRMFMDSQTKAYTLFLDAVKLLVQRHWPQLDDWLFLLLERLFLKISSDVLPTIENNILDLLQLIRENFPHVSLIRDTFKIIVDPLQRYNIKFRLHLLKHLSQLAILVSKTQAVFYNIEAPDKSDTAAVLSKVLFWSDVAELKDCCNRCIADLFHMNAPLITNASLLLKPRESEQIDVIVKKALKSSKEVDHDTENGDDINESLKLTSQEIQTYKYDDVDSEVNTKPVTPLSKKSLEERMAAINNSIKNHKDPSEEVVHTGSPSVQYPANVWSSPSVWNEIFGILRPESERSLEEKAQNMKKLIDLVKSASPETVAHYTVKIIKCTVYLLPSLDVQIAMVDQVEINLIQSVFSGLKIVLLIKECVVHVEPFVDVLAVKTFNTISNKDNNKMVRFVAQDFLHAMVEVLPIVPILPILCSHAFDEATQSAYTAIKEINEVVKLKSKEDFYPHFHSTMNVLMIAYGSTESAVRKAVTFCIVELYRVYGESEVAPYIKKLDASKRRLLDVYIKRQK